MRLLPRHYILIAIIILFGIYNFTRLGHRRPPTVTPAPPPPAILTPRPETPAWAAFDHAATLRDAPDPQFQPTLKPLDAQIEAVSDPAQRADLKGCRTWLVFYRQGVLHPSPDTSWHTRSGEHLDSCVQHHQDIAS
jgi:hypothetical protein